MGVALLLYTQCLIGYYSYVGDWLTLHVCKCDYKHVHQLLYATSSFLGKRYFQYCSVSATGCSLYGSMKPPYGYHLYYLHIFEYLTGNNMALYINDNHILWHHMDAFRLTMLECSYFISPDYLVSDRWIRVMLLFLTTTIVVGPNLYLFIKFLPRVIEYFPCRVYVVACHHIVAVLDVINCFIVTAFSILYSILSAALLILLIVLLATV